MERGGADSPGAALAAGTALATASPRIHNGQRRRVVENDAEDRSPRELNDHEREVPSSECPRMVDNDAHPRPRAALTAGAALTTRSTGSCIMADTRRVAAESRSTRRPVASRDAGRARATARARASGELNPTPTPGKPLSQRVEIVHRHVDSRRQIGSPLVRDLGVEALLGPPRLAGPRRHDTRPRIEREVPPDESNPGRWDQRALHAESEHAAVIVDGLDVQSSLLVWRDRLPVYQRCAKRPDACRLGTAQLREVDVVAALDAEVVASDVRDRDTIRRLVL
nr:hypothetical protein [Deltaproteobacteria bacterium]